MQTPLVDPRTGTVVPAVRPATNYRDIATRWTRALHDAYLGVHEVSGALAAAAADIDAMVA